MANSEQLFCQKCGHNEYNTVPNGKQLGAYCSKCGTWIKWLPQDKPKLHFGKYKDKYISDIDDIGWLRWALKNVRFSATYRKAVENQIIELEYRFK